MADGNWRIISLKLLAAKLFPAADISERLLAIDNLDQLISIAVDEGITGLLTGEILSNLEELANSETNQTAKDDDSNEKSTYQIVGEYESDIKNKKLSVNSPLAKGLINKSVDDLVEINSPKGQKSYTIKSVKYI